MAEHQQLDTLEVHSDVVGSVDIQSISFDMQSVSGDMQSVSGDMHSVSGDVQSVPDDMQSVFTDPVAFRTRSQQIFTDCMSDNTQTTVTRRQHTFTDHVSARTRSQSTATLVDFSKTPILRSRKKQITPTQLVIRKESAKTYSRKLNFNSDSKAKKSSSVANSSETIEKIELALKPCCNAFRFDQPKKVKTKRKINLWHFVDRRQSDRLLIKNFKFPFSYLPLECKSKVFSYLSVFDRAGCMLVCQEWKQLIQSPSMWPVIDFDLFHPCEHKATNGKCPRSCKSLERYDIYKQKISKFTAFLENIKPRVRHMVFNFDISQPGEPWGSVLVKLLAAADCRSLQHVELNWCETPMRPKCLDKYCCLPNKVRRIFRHHLLQLYPFRHIFGLLTMRAPNIQHLDIPFDWRPQTIVCLGRLKQLKFLALRKYVVLYNIQQEEIDRVLEVSSSLEHLTIEVIIPGLFRHKTTYIFKHGNLSSLDLSECHGIFLKNIELPRLKSLEFCRNYWDGDLLNPNLLPCLYRVLVRGAPGLTHLNQKKLYGTWTQFVDYDLNKLLTSCCPCQDHSSTW